MAMIAFAFARLDRLAAALLLPYLAPVTFAACLSDRTGQRKPLVLG